jgi:hypothetical protein
MRAEGTACSAEVVAAIDVERASGAGRIGDTVSTGADCGAGAGAAALPIGPPPPPMARP